MHKHDPTIVEAAKLIANAKRVVFFLGAGMSVASGIPTFRGKGGLWSRPGWRFTLASLTVILFHVYMKYPDVWKMVYPVVMTLLASAIVYILTPLLVIASIGTGIGWSKPWLRPVLWVVYKLCFHDGVSRAKPNAGHYFITWLQANLGAENVVTATQNVDRLEEDAGATNLIPVHFTYERFFCADCGFIVHKSYHRKKMEWRSPKCERCRKRALRPGCLLFKDGRYNRRTRKFAKARYEFIKLTEPTDLLIVIGTSGKVRPAKYFPGFIGTDCKLLEINPAPEAVYAHLQIPINEGVFKPVEPHDPAPEYKKGIMTGLHVRFPSEKALEKIVVLLRHDHDFGKGDWDVKVRVKYKSRMIHAESVNGAM